MIEDIEFVLDALYIKNDMIDNSIHFYKELLLTVSLDKLLLIEMAYQLLIIK